MFTLAFNRYDTEATYFDEGVRSSKRKQLEEKLLHVIVLKLHIVSNLTFLAYTLHKLELSCMPPQSVLFHNY